VSGASRSQEDRLEAYAKPFRSCGAKNADAQEVRRGRLTYFASGTLPKISLSYLNSALTLALTQKGQYRQPLPQQVPRLRW
jgi:hypothetical protein